MPITASVTNQQIAASVSETQIDVSVGGGVGPTGTAGTAATVSVGAVTTGAPGSSASVVNAGTSSAAVLDFTIPAGATGATGEQGAPGVQGEPGVAGAKGDKGDTGDTGATGAAGSSGVISVSAPITNSGTSSAAALALATGTGLTVSGGSLVVSYGTSAGTACEGNDARLSDSRTPTSHTHGNLTNAGAIGSTSGLPVITTTSGVLTTGAFGTSAGQFCQGNDSRLSDSRTPTTHASTHQTGGSDAVTNTVASPSQITSNQNDYSLTSDINRISSDAARDITGVAAGSSGQVIVLVNVGSFTITLKHQSTSSTAANRVVVPWANDFAIPADGSATLVYDSTTSRWRAL